MIPYLFLKRMGHKSVLLSLLVGLLLLLVYLIKLEYYQVCFYFHSPFSSCLIVWAIVSWLLLVWVVCAQWWADMAPQWSVFLWYYFFCLSHGKLSIRTRFGYQGRRCSGEQRRREGKKAES